MFAVSLVTLVAQKKKICFSSHFCLFLLCSIAFHDFRVQWSMYLERLVDFRMDWNRSNGQCLLVRDKIHWGQIFFSVEICEWIVEEEVMLGWRGDRLTERETKRINEWPPVGIGFSSGEIQLCRDWETAWLTLIERCVFVFVSVCWKGQVIHFTPERCH